MAKKSEISRKVGKPKEPDRVKFIIGREKSEDQVLAAIRGMAEKAGLK